MEEREENWLKPAEVLRLLGYSAIATGVICGVFGVVLLLVSKYVDYYFDTLIQEYKLASLKVFLYMIVPGGVFLAASKTLEKSKEKQTVGWKYAVVIFLIVLSVVSPAVGYFIFDIPRENEGIMVVLWPFIGFYVQLVVNVYDRHCRVESTYFGRNGADSGISDYKKLAEIHIDEIYCNKWRKLKMEIDKIELINAYLKKQLWMNFKLCSMSLGEIKMFGFMDEAGEEKIKIIFDQPYMMLCTFSFAYKGNGDFISLVSGNEAIEINKKYCVIQGNEIYRISNTDVADAMYIAAKCIEVQIMD